MLTQICQYLRNWFALEKMIGSFKVTNGELSYADGSAVPLLTGQYFRIIGSVFNDGVHKLGDAQDELADESWTGAVWSMAVPPDFLALVSTIDTWVTANQTALNSPYSSESFGGYSYSIRSGGASGGTGGLSWQDQFAAALSPWRKI